MLLSAEYEEVTYLVKIEFYIYDIPLFQTNFVFSSTIQNVEINEHENHLNIHNLVD